ncbi:MAG: beta-galactosidase [Dehalococcoidia bacterium]|nr:beta-galactosidase [Dehalococcoidia bacterium]
MSLAAPEQSPVADERTPFEPPPARRGLAITVVAGAFGCIVVLAGLAFAFNRLAWPQTEPLGSPVMGINYSCDYAEYLLLEDPTRGLGWAEDDRPGRVQWCAGTFATLLRDTGAAHVRISVYWDEVEPREGEFDFALLDALIETAAAHDAKVFLTVGIKAQRHPEYYIPGWALDDVHMPHGAVVTDDPLLRERALRMVEAVLRHAAPSPVVEAWGADNEPFVPSQRASMWRLGRDFVQEEVGLVRALDPQQRPVVITQAQHHLWDSYRREREWILEDADVLGMSLYPFRNYSVLGVDMVVPIPELAPVHPNYAAHRKEAHERGREYWITELQAEPWADFDMHLISPGRPSPNLSPEKLRKSVEYARRTGADRAYLWGAEWWLFQRERYGDATWMDLGARLLAGEYD